MGNTAAWCLVIGLGLKALGPACLAGVNRLEPGEVAREFDQRAWGTREGLPDDRVFAIHQTRDGFLWVATQQGLARFDGLTFTRFDRLNSPALVNDDCRGLAEDTGGNLWVGTAKGLFRVAGNQLVPHGRGDTAILAYDRGIGRSQRGGLWAALGTPIQRILPDSLQLYYPSERERPVSGGGFRLFEEEEGKTLWLGATTGLVRFDIQRERFESAPETAEFAGKLAVSSRAGIAGERWVLFSDLTPHQQPTNGWLGCFKDGKWLRRPTLDKPDLSGCLASLGLLAFDTAGALWLPADFGAVHRYHKGAFQRLPVSGTKPLEAIQCAFRDREGNLWLGTSESGLRQWIPRRAVSYTSADGLPDDNVWSICQGRDGGVWLGGDGGVSRFKDGRLTHFTGGDGLELKDVRAVAEDREGVVWVGTMRSLARIREGKVVAANLPGPWEESKVRVIHAGADGAVWIGTVRGLTCLRDGARTKYTRADGLGGDDVRVILESRAGGLWIGAAEGGLSRLREGRFTTLTTTHGLSHNNVWALHEDAQGALWIGTESGLNRLKDGRLTRFSRDQGLPDNLVNCLLEDDFGRLWVGHDRGVYWVWKERLNEVAEGAAENVRAVTYDESDGLPTLDVNGQKSNPAACKTADGRLWFPTSAGVAVIDPARAVLDEVAPVAVVEEVRANGRVLYSNQPPGPALGHTNALAAVPGPAFELPPGGGRVLEFRFTANTFLAPEKARFRYRLWGLSDHWIETGARREVILIDLKPGAYRFEVAARNHHGVWQERGYEMAFSVAPFLYQAWWFYPGCGGLLAGLAGLAVVWRVRELRRIHELERQNALNEQRKRIARDIHDELGAQLTRIAQLGDEADGAAASAERVRRRVQHISRIAEEAVDSIGGLVWANNPEYDTLEDLVAYLREYAANYLAESGIQTHFQLPETVPALPVTGLCRRNLVMLVKEALQNVRKHADASRVALRITVEDGVLELEVADDGQGLSTNEAGRAGNGLANMRERVAELDGEVRIESHPGKGTRIQVRVPLGEKP
jgi:signal transduction histidine kinase/ligand-binding sensor domain-containing protein